ncbi:uncharacterized protein LOC125023842 [Mugil cephalus]|uniref:uncharacterized protein LOC125023842 n=1 Tax=Mugil cephalus TaxID=48193 RepID=UPI001FB6BAEF|nr:uncharacterized protein LOC125023842 [Mugil cephalus]
MKLFLLFVILVGVSHHASGLEVYEGAESVLLPCYLHDLPEDPVVVWSRNDLNPTTIYRHQERAKSHVPNQRFISRTSMSPDALETGNFNLTLNKPQVWDSGIYTCSILSDGLKVEERQVELQVKVPYTFPAEAWVLLILVIAVALGLSIHLWLNFIPVSKVELKEGMSSVVLPFKTIIKLPVGTTVEWSRSEPEPMKVHVYESSDLPVKQDQMYRDRTEMETDRLKHGDLSLTLRNPCYRDRGTYICTVHKDSKILTQKVVRLWVKDVLVEMEEWSTSVTLPFKTTRELPEGSTIEWKRIKPQPMVVHVYENDRDQTDEQDEYYRNRTKMNDNPLESKDLSLTLTKPGLSDRGTYVCTVSHDGDILTQRAVVCRIKEVLVEVKEWEKSLKLPFKTTHTLPEGSAIEWKRTEPKPMVVHVYENGKDKPEKQNEQYRGRTKMNDNPLQSKDLSLTLTKPGLIDRGTYVCTVSKDGDILTQRAVVCWAHVFSDVVVEVNESSKSVILPFKTTRHLPSHVRIEWKHIEPEPMVVHVHEDGRDKPEEQNERYRGRTTMNIDPLQSKDLSVKLHEPALSDGGTYICTVSHDEKLLLQRTVLCRFKAITVVVQEWSESVTLPFKTTHELPENIEIIWKRTEPEPMIVHVYKNGRNHPQAQNAYYRSRTNMDRNPLQSKDLSLTLTKPGLSDRGTYVCTVSHDGDILIQRAVLCHIKGV